MSPVPNSSGRATVIQGSFFGGRPRIPVVAAPPAPIQPRLAGPQPIQPRMPHPHVAQRQAAPPAPVNPYATPPLAHHQRMAQSKLAQPRAVLPQRRTGILPVNPAKRWPDAYATQTVAQRVSNGEAFQLPANLSKFGSTPGHMLPGPVREKMESFFGTSFADIRVHVGAQASSIGALAFTHGSNLYFAPGQYNPNTAQGQQLLGHELAHVMQQRAGRVRNPFGAGIAVVQDRTMEAEAERMGSQAAGHQGPVQAKQDVIDRSNKYERETSAAHRTGREKKALAEKNGQSKDGDHAATDSVITTQHRRKAVIQRVRLAWLLKQGYPALPITGLNDPFYVSGGYATTTLGQIYSGGASRWWSSAGTWGWKRRKCTCT